MVNLNLKTLIPKEAQVFFVLLKLVPLVIFGYIKAIIWCFIPRRFKIKKDIAGQTVLITGAGSGVGRQLAIEFSKHSVNLVLMDLFMGPLNETAVLLDPSSKAFLYECDVSDRYKVYETADHIKGRVGKVDILVNNAGIVCGKRFLDLPDDKIQRTLEVNTLAHFWMIKAFLPDMLSSNRGHIVAIASMAALAGFPRLTEYCASKYGAIGLMESLIWELQSEHVYGVKVTMVCPNLITTGLFEGSKPTLSVNMTPEYVAQEVVQGVLEEKQLLMLPGWLYIIILLKWTMPLDTVVRFYRNTGLLSFMDDFKGRMSAPYGNGFCH